MVTRTTISLDTAVHQKVTLALKRTNQRLNPLVNSLLGEWAEEQERTQYREELRRQFRSALSKEHRAEVEMLEKEWAEVDEESALGLQDLP